MEYCRPALELRIRNERKPAEVLIQLDRASADRFAVLDGSFEVFWRCRAGLELDWSAHLLHFGVDGEHCLCGLGIEIVIVEDAALAERLAALAHVLRRELLVAFWISHGQVDRVERSLDVRMFPHGVILEPFHPTPLIPTSLSPPPSQPPLTTCP